MKKKNLTRLAILANLLVVLGGCSTPSLPSEEPMGTAKKPTAKEARAYCEQHAELKETVEQCVRRILRL